MNDLVNSPSHYTKGGIECIDAIEASMSEDEFLGWLKGNILKYIWRWRDKGGLQDIEKANFYTGRMLVVLRRREARETLATEKAIDVSPSINFDPRTARIGDPYPMWLLRTGAN